MRPVSRFTHIPGLHASAIGGGGAPPPPAVSMMPPEMMPPEMMPPESPMFGGAHYSPTVDFGAYFGSMPGVMPPQPTATPSYNLVQAPDGHMPTDQAIAAAIARILEAADLSTVTMRHVRDELALVFGMDLSSRREFISHTVQSMIQQYQA
ncbi:hypothetical protein H4R21_006268 [Coemansia helicoidea]|uniref:Uncharacterized protein n=1 Tax=Coemansia helicoidea TaxID=1286919 RepID=A0ACC1KMX9_9FUNG|nr:hypothetical protein H4R21_006268 [Coemansia helicoidea]